MNIRIMRINGFIGKIIKWCNINCYSYFQNYQWNRNGKNYQYKKSDDKRETSIS